MKEKNAEIYIKGYILKPLMYAETNRIKRSNFLPKLE